MAFFNLLYHIYDVTVYQCKSNKRKAAFQLRLQTLRSRAAPTSGSHSQLSPPRTHFLLLSAMSEMHGLNHKRNKRNHHHIYYEFQHHSKTEHRKIGFLSRSHPARSLQEGVTYLSLLHTGCLSATTTPLPCSLISCSHGFHCPQLRETMHNSAEATAGTQQYMEESAKLKWLQASPFSHFLGAVRLKYYMVML